MPALRGTRASLHRFEHDSTKRSMRVRGSGSRQLSCMSFGTAWPRVRDQRKTVKTWQLFWRVLCVSWGFKRETQGGQGAHEVHWRGLENKSERDTCCSRGTR